MSVLKWKHEIILSTPLERIAYIHVQNSEWLLWAPEIAGFVLSSCTPMENESNQGFIPKAINWNGSHCCNYHVPNGLMQGSHQVLNCTKHMHVYKGFLVAYHPMIMGSLERVTTFWYKFRVRRKGKLCAENATIKVYGFYQVYFPLSSWRPEGMAMQKHLEHTCQATILAMAFHWKL